jgi:SIR2-like domain
LFLLFPGNCQTKSFFDCLYEAASLPPTVWQEIRALARQLEHAAILPLVGAGASYDCGQPLAAQVAEEMFKGFGGGDRPSDLTRSKTDLGVVADAYFLEGRQKAVIDALGLADTSRWPAATGYDEHFCGYRVLARLAREGLLSEAISLNYDCAFERGLEDEGFAYRPFKAMGKEWLDQATVISGAADHVLASRRGEMVLTKAHGCAASYRRKIRSVATDNAEDVREEVIVRRTQLMDWRGDFWARDLFADRARTHVMLLIGVSGQDPVIHIALTRALEDVFKRLPNSGYPRVVAIDVNPDTVALRNLLDQGCGKKPPPTGAVTKVRVPGGTSLTAVLIALGVEMIALRLERHKVPIANLRASRVTLLMVTIPAILRWCYRLERRTSSLDHYQYSKVRMSKQKAYVPIECSAPRVEEMLRVRELLLGHLGVGPYESVAQAVKGCGFVLKGRPGRAFLPLGLTAEELTTALPSELRSAAQELDAPEDVELILVAREGFELIGRSVHTGEGVRVP